MKRLFGLLLTMLLAQGAAANESAMKELMPTEKLRVALVFAPSMSIFFVVKEADGRPRGVTADLADALGRKLNVPVERVLFPNSGLATDALEAGQVDVAFMPVDEERQEAHRVRAELRARRKHLHGDRGVGREDRRARSTAPACG